MGALPLVIPHPNPLLHTSYKMKSSKRYLYNTLLGQVQKLGGDGDGCLGFVNHNEFAGHQ